jgi:rubrerythrin
MVKMSHQVEDAVREAIKLEINGRNFFQHAEEVTRHELGKKMFRRLADEEIKHLETFSRLFSRILKGEDWKRHIKSEELEEKSDLIERLKASVKGEEGKGEIEALRIGMELEESSIKLFGKAAEDIDDPVAREVFQKITEEEKFHYDLLQAQYDSLTHSGFWLDSAEFQMDGKW